MSEHDRRQFLESLVNLESRLFNLRLPASGSLYFRRDLNTVSRKVAVDLNESSKPDSIYMGPSTSLPLWFGRRHELNVDRGPRELAYDLHVAGISY